MRSLAHHRETSIAVEHNERDLCQVDEMDLIEDLLPHARIHCCLFLPVQRIQVMVAVESKVASIGRELVARQQRGIVGVIAKVVIHLGDVIPARNGSSGWRCLPPVQERAKERVVDIVLDVELDANHHEVVLNDRFAIDTPGLFRRCRVLELQALSSFDTHAIGVFRPAVVLQQFIGRRQIKLRTVYTSVITRMISRPMVGA